MVEGKSLIHFLQWVNSESDQFLTWERTESASLGRSQTRVWSLCSHLPEEPHQGGELRFSSDTVHTVYVKALLDTGNG